MELTTLIGSKFNSIRWDFKIAKVTKNLRIAQGPYDKKKKKNYYSAKIT